MKPIMHRLSVALPMVAFSFALPANGEVTSGKADAPVPSVQQLRSAAAEYDAGRRAFADKDYDGAAAHFENAFNDAPTAEAVRSAIRAHRKAGHLARAATLAEVAAQRYPKDAPTGALIRATLSESSKLHKVTLRCSPDCGVAADGRAITLADSPLTVFFLEPGIHDLVVSWSNDRTTAQKVAARAGGKDDITLEAPVPPPPPPGRVATQEPVAPLSAQPSLVSPVQPGQADAGIAVRTKPFGPVVFVVGAAMTAAGVGLVTWSGIDAENNPGTATVTRQCMGLGPTCPAYQQGLASQLRTNIALGVTGGLALTTAIVGIFFTQWSSPKRLAKGFGLMPTGAVVLGGAALGVGGAF